MRSALALPVILALVCGVLACRRRLVWRLGPYGRELAPSFAFLVWLLGLEIGELTGSLAGMAWCATAPLVLVAPFAIWRSRPVRFRPPRWHFADWVAFTVLAAFALTVAGGDNICHSSIVSTYLRGNIPPRALNDPTSPLVYHTLFDAAAAVLVRSFRIDTELGLDLVTVLCVGVSIANLGVISRLLFTSKAAQTCSRLLFLLGFGPSYVRLFRGENVIGLHGQTVQPLIELLMRRPVALACALFTFGLASLLTRFRSRVLTRRGGTVHMPPQFLLVLAFLLPAASEELVILLGVLGASLVVLGRLSRAWAGACGVALVLGMALAGVFRASISGVASMAIPKLMLAWPPALPHWQSPQDGIPLFSMQAGAVFVEEYGPLCIGALAVALVGRDARRRAVAAMAVLGLAAATCLTLRGWPKADLDRLLFWGALAGLMLSGIWVEVLEKVMIGRWQMIATIRASVALLVVTALPSPLVLGAWRMRHQPRDLDGIGIQRERPGGQVRAALAIVGPREPILTDLASAQFLIIAGFSVIAPLSTHMVNSVVESEFDPYVSRNSHRASWLFLPPDHPRIAGKPVQAEHAGYLLARP